MYLTLHLKPFYRPSSLCHISLSLTIYTESYLLSVSPCILNAETTWFFNLTAITYDIFPDFLGQTFFVDIRFPPNVTHFLEIIVAIRFFKMKFLIIFQNHRTFWTNMSHICIIYLKLRSNRTGESKSGSTLMINETVTCGISFSDTFCC